MNDRRKVYLDYAATTPVDPRVVEAMMPYLNEKFGNTTSLHSLGQDAKVALEKSRESIADSLNARAKNIVFVGSATESSNFALKGIAFANRKKGKHIIISQIEHPCVWESAKWLEKQGFSITRLKVNSNGFVNPDELRSKIRPDTLLVSIMHANNEIGTIEPIKEIGEVCEEKEVYFHTDATQSFGKIPLDTSTINIDLLTASAHKLYGPKGAALLFIKEGIKLDPLLHGGGHERGLRSGTVNVPAIAGFSRAVELCMNEMESEGRRLSILRDRLIDKSLDISGARLNGDRQKRLPNNVNLSFDFVEGESMLMLLDDYGIQASTGSACSSAKLEPSRVLLALGLMPQHAHGSLRFSLGRWTTDQDISYVSEVLPGVIERLRKISPFK